MAAVPAPLPRLDLGTLGVTMSAHFESGFFAGEAAWHGFGTVVPENIPWAQAIKLAGLAKAVR